MRSQKVRHTVLQGPRGGEQPGHSAAVWVHAAHEAEAWQGPVSARRLTAYHVHPKKTHKPHPTDRAHRECENPAGTQREASRSPANRAESSWTLQTQTPARWPWIASLAWRSHVPGTAQTLPDPRGHERALPEPGEA